MASLNLLSSEVLLEICSSVPIADLKSLRLTCKRFSHLAAIELYKEVLLRLPFIDSFKKFDMISSHSVFKHYVRVFYYDANTLRKDLVSDTGLISFRRWKEDIKYNPHNGLEDTVEPTYPFKNLRRKKLRTRFRRYCKRLFEETVDTDRLIDLMSRLPMLQRVELGYPFVKYTDPIVQDTLSCPTPAGTTDGGRFRHSLSLLAAADTSKAALKSLKIHGMDEQYFKEYFQKQLPAPQFLKSLEHLVLEVPSDKSPDIPWDEEVVRGVADFISAAPNLKTLDLSFDTLADIIPPQLDPVRLDILLSVRSSWPRLTTISLSSAETEGQSLIEFLAGHRGTLKSLRLSNMVLTQCSIMMFIRSLQRNLDLEHASLEGTLSNYNGETWVASQSDKPFHTLKAETEAEDEHTLLEETLPNCDDEAWDSSQSDKPPRTLKAEVEHFIVHGGDFPIQPVRENLLYWYKYPENFYDCVVFHGPDGDKLTTPQCCQGIMGHTMAIGQIGDNSWRNQ